MWIKFAVRPKGKKRMSVNQIFTKTHFRLTNMFKRTAIKFHGNPRKRLVVDKRMYAIG